MRSFGSHWCPCCLTKREFVTADIAVNDADYARCISCEWQRGKRIDDSRDPAAGELDVVPSVPVELQREAEAARLEEHNQEMRRRGYHRKPSKAKVQELLRRHRESVRRG